MGILKRDKEKQGEGVAPQADPASPPTEAMRAQQPAAAHQPAPAPAPSGPASTRPAPPATPAAKAGAADIGERLDGIRGWLGDLDNTVRMRSRIGLVLAAIAIGAAGAAIYLSLDAKSQSASDTQVGDLRRQVSDLEDRLQTTSEETSSLQSNIAAARTQASAANQTVAGQKAQIRGIQADIKDLRQTIQAQAAAAAAAPTPDLTPPDTGNDGNSGGTGNSP